MAGEDEDILKRLYIDPKKLASGERRKEIDRIYDNTDRLDTRLRVLDKALASDPAARNPDWDSYLSRAKKDARADESKSEAAESESESESEAAEYDAELDAQRARVAAESEAAEYDAELDAQRARVAAETGDGDSAAARRERLADRIALANDMNKALSGGADRTEEQMARFAARALALDVDAGQFTRFMERHGLNRQSRTGRDTAATLMDMSKDNKASGFGGLAEYDRMQAAKAAGRRLGWDRGPKPLNTDVASNLARMAKSQEKRGNTYTARRLADAASQEKVSGRMESIMESEGNPLYDNTRSSIAQRRRELLDRYWDPQDDE